MDLHEKYINYICSIGRYKNLDVDKWHDLKSHINGNWYLARKCLQLAKEGKPMPWETWKRDFKITVDYSSLENGIKEFNDGRTKYCELLNTQKTTRWEVFCESCRSFCRSVFGGVE